MCPGRVEHVERPAPSVDDVAGGDGDVGNEVDVGALLEPCPRCLDLLLLLTRQRVRAEPVHRRIDPCGLQQSSGGGVVTVGVRHEDRLDGLAVERPQEVVDVGGVARGRGR